MNERFEIGDVIVEIGKAIKYVIISEDESCYSCKSINTKIILMPYIPKEDTSVNFVKIDKWDFEKNMIVNSHPQTRCDGKVEQG